MISDCVPTLFLWLIINFISFGMIDKFHSVHNYWVLSWFSSSHISACASFFACRRVPTLPCRCIDSYSLWEVLIHDVIHGDAFNVGVNPVSYYGFVEIPLWFPFAFFQALFCGWNSLCWSCVYHYNFFGRGGTQICLLQRGLVSIRLCSKTCITFWDFS